MPASPNAQTYEIERDHTTPDTSSAANACKSTLWQIVGLITGYVGAAHPGHWTVERSSDGASAGDGNLPGTAFNAAKIVRSAAEGTAHTWWQLYNATLGLRLVVSYVGATDNVCDVRLGKTVSVAGTVTNSPTLASSTATSVLAFFASASSSSHRAHFAIGADGQFHVGLSISGVIRGHWMMRKRKMPSGVVDSFPWVLDHHYEPTHGDGAFHFQNNSVLSWYQGGTGGSPLRTRSLLDTAARTVVAWMPARLNGSSGTLPAQMYAQQTVAQDPQLGAWIGVPVMVQVSGGNDYLGTIEDMWIIPSVVTVGQLNNQDGGDATRVNFGCMQVPWDSNLAPTVS